MDQQPDPGGGQVADTACTILGEILWEELADDVQLSNDAVVRRIRWWGFYGSDVGGTSNPPSGPETIRVRIYDARPGDALPGNILFEEQFSDAHRTATGRFVFSGGPRPEFDYWVELNQPFTMLAGRRYWLSVFQVGDPDSMFRWEQSIGDNTPYALQWTYEPYWQYTTQSSNQAFQLLNIPEPLSGGMLLLGVASFHICRRKGGM